MQDNPIKGPKVLIDKDGIKFKITKEQKEIIDKMQKELSNNENKMF